MNDDEERILRRRIEVRRPRDEVMDARAARTREPELFQRPPVDRRRALAVEAGQRRPFAGGVIDSSDLRWVDCAFPAGDDDGRARLAREIQSAERSPGELAHLANG